MWQSGCLPSLAGGTKCLTSETFAWVSLNPIARYLIFPVGNLETADESRRNQCLWIATSIGVVEMPSPGTRFAGKYAIRTSTFSDKIMNIIYIIGLVVVVLAVLSFFGLR